MSGPQPVLVTQGIDTVRLSGPGGHRGRRASPLPADRVGASTGDLGTGLRSALDVVDQFAPVHAMSSTPANNAVYAKDDLAKALRASARTIRANVGAEIITVDHGSWDHHTGIGTTESGLVKEDR